MVNYPVKVVQVNLAKLDKPPTPTGTAPNGATYPDPHPSIGVFIRW
jgi:hypothetical protein